MTAIRFNTASHDMPEGISIQRAGPADLELVNQVVERALMTWTLPERVKRLALMSYRYQALDFDYMTLAVARTPDNQIRGVAAWEEAQPRGLPEGKTGLLLHGLYVDPSVSRRGLGRRLLAAALEAAAAAGRDGLLVKAQADAAPFFEACSFKRLPASVPSRDYELRYWRTCSNCRT